MANAESGKTKEFDIEQERHKCVFLFFSVTAVVVEVAECAGQIAELCTNQTGGRRRGKGKTVKGETRTDRRKTPEKTHLRY